MIDQPEMDNRPSPLRRGVFAFLRDFRALGLSILFVGGLLLFSIYLLWGWISFGAESDQANIREWLEETRVFRKTLPELIRDYLALRDEFHPAPDEKYEPIESKAEEVAEQLKAMTDPLRIYQGQLPLFLEVYALKIHFLNGDAWNAPTIEWESPVPKPRQSNSSILGQLRHPVIPGEDGQPRAEIYCEYRIHAFNKVQHDQEQEQKIFWWIGGVIVIGTVLGGIIIWLFLIRERRREFAQLETIRQKEKAENLMLAEKLVAQEVFRQNEELDRKLLQQSLEAAKQESRAAEAEKTTLQLRSQLYASIGIMAGSYAHNIKNLLVRPNDLLSRCLERTDLQGEQALMLQEIRTTLGTVTERLQQILRTVRRDPSQTEMGPLDINHLMRDTHRTWNDIAREKWKLQLELAIPGEPVLIQGDISHLQQAIENLLFNARDATFEMRNHIRDAARGITDPQHRRQALMDAAAWKGIIQIRLRSSEDNVILEIQDNGIGMTAEVLERCKQTHFSTKRDNALYQGYNSGMGLGLSFVVVVVEHHQAEIAIESQPFQGALFRVRFPRHLKPSQTDSESLP